MTNQESLKKAQSCLLGNYRREITMVRGSGSEIWDADGKRYLDMGGGVAVNSLGHAHPELVHALATQAATLVHCSNYFHNPQATRLAERLVQLTGPGRMFFCNSGLEADEALFKLARKFGHETGGRHVIITTLGSFHGRSLAGISATGQEKVKVGFGPPTPGFVHVPFNDLQAVADAITAETCAVLIEGIQGEGGIYCATAEYLLGLRELCDKHQLLLLIDAIQCGMYRTGCFQSTTRILEEQELAEPWLPDAISMAKSLGGGVPIGATWIAEKYTELLGPGSHGTTFGGNPLACAAANCVLDVIERDRLDVNARRQGERLASRLAVIAANHPRKIKECRGLGLMLGVAFHIDAGPVQAACLQAGLILLPAGGNTLRWLPALNVDDDSLDEAVEIFEEVVKLLPSEN